MLVLTRKLQEQILIGDNIRITIVRIKGQTVRVGIEAPDDVRIMRSELADKLADQPQAPQPADESTCRSEQPAASSHVPESNHCTAEGHAAPLASRLATRTATTENRRRIPGASCSTTIRRPQRLGPSSLRSLHGSMR